MVFSPNLIALAQKLISGETIFTHTCAGVDMWLWEIKASIFRLLSTKIIIIIFVIFNIFYQNDCKKILVGLFSNTHYLIMKVYKTHPPLKLSRHRTLNKVYNLLSWVTALQHCSTAALLYNFLVGLIEHFQSGNIK